MLKKLLNQSNYIYLNKILIKKIGLYETIILGEFINAYEYYRINNMLKDKEYFYYTKDKIEKELDIKKYMFDTSIKHLQELKILEVKKMGLPRQNYYKINDKYIQEILENTDKSIENNDNNNPNLENPLSANFRQQDTQNSPTCDNKIGCAYIYNNNEYNNNEYNNNEYSTIAKSTTNDFVEDFDNENINSTFTNDKVLSNNTDSNVSVVIADNINEAVTNGDVNIVSSSIKELDVKKKDSTSTAPVKDIKTNNNNYSHNQAEISFLNENENNLTNNTILEKDAVKNENNEENEIEKIISGFIEWFKSYNKFVLKKTLQLNEIFKTRDVIEKEFIKSRIKNYSSIKELGEEMGAVCKYLDNNYEDKYCPRINNIFDFKNKYNNILNQMKNNYTNNKKSSIVDIGIDIL